MFYHQKYVLNVKGLDILLFLSSGSSSSAANVVKELKKVSKKCKSIYANLIRKHKIKINCNSFFNKQLILRFLAHLLMIDTNK